MFSNNSNELPQTTPDDKISLKGFLSTVGDIVGKFAGVKNYLSFFLTLLCIVGSLALGWFKGVDQTVLLPSLLGIYVLGRAGQKSVGMIAASRDPNADTRAVIQELNDIKPPKIQD